MQFIGERFPIDLPEDEPEEAPPSVQPAAFPGLDFVKDIQERATTAPRLPSPPSLKSTPGGFPVHKKRTGISRFKQARQNAQDNQETQTLSSTASKEAASQRPQAARGSERQEIDSENNERIAKMSDSEIAQERQELMEGLPPSLIEKLLRRANLNQDDQKQDWKRPTEASDTFPNAAPSQEPEREQPRPKKTVSFAADVSPPNIKSPLASTASPHLTLPQPQAIETEAEAIHLLASSRAAHLNQDDDPPDHISSTTNTDDQPIPHLTHSIHFPSAPAPPALDPSSPSFLTDLHDKYFPSLPSDASKLSWMSSPPLPSSTSYNPSASALAVKDLRFDFTGALLPPSRSLEIPVTRGLHHHGDAPDAAGYTVGELAGLARSTVPGQRCVAFLTLGRVLFRLGRGEFGGRGRDGEIAGDYGGGDASGDEDEDEEEEEEDIGGGSELEKGLWACIKEGHVLETLEREVNRQGGHMSAKAYATEALWLWQQGGGKQVRAE